MPLQCRINDLVRERQKQLSEATLSRRVIAQNRRKCCVSQRLGKALSKRLPGSRIVAQSVTVSKPGSKVGVADHDIQNRHMWEKLTEESTSRHVSGVVQSAARPVD